MKTHTPGPWKLTKIHQDEWHINGRQICVGSGEFGAESDARLISAAPEMLEALEHLEYELQFLSLVAQQKVIDAIKKARGES